MKGYAPANDCCVFVWRTCVYRYREREKKSGSACACSIIGKIKTLILNNVIEQRVQLVPETIPLLMFFVIGPPDLRESLMVMPNRLWSTTDHRRLDRQNSCKSVCLWGGCLIITRSRLLIATPLITVRSPSISTRTGTLRHAAWGSEGQLSSARTTNHWSHDQKCSIEHFNFGLEF